MVPAGRATTPVGLAAQEASAVEGALQLPGLRQHEAHGLFGAGEKSARSVELGELPFVRPAQLLLVRTPSWLHPGM